MVYATFKHGGRSVTGANMRELNIPLGRPLGSERTVLWKISLEDIIQELIEMRDDDDDTV